MSSEWSDTRLEELISVKHGFAFKGEYFTDQSTAHQLVTPGNFAIGGGFQLGKPKFYSGPVPPDYVLSRGDVVVTMTDLSRGADTLGFAGVVPETPGTVWLHNQRVGLVKVKPGAPVRIGYLHYLMRSAEYRHWVVSSATGSTVKHTSPGRICSFGFKLPPRAEQAGIEAMLTTLDDRVALLRESNTTLEAIAQALFKSWFVDFDPVRAKQQGLAPAGMDEATAALFPDSFDGSALGSMPTGWRPGVLGDIVRRIKSQLPPSELRAAMNYVGLEHLPRKSLSLVNWETADGLESAKAKFSDGDVLFGKLRPYFHKVVVAPFDGVCSTDILVCQSKQRAYDGFAAMQLFSAELIAYADRLSNGAKMPRIGWNDIAAYPLIVPTEPIAAAYAEVVAPLLDRTKGNVFRAQTLTTLRDTLLPRLISGQLRLPEALP